MYCSTSKFKHAPIVGLGVGVAAVEEGAGVAVAVTPPVGTGVEVAVDVGTGVGGGTTTFLPAAATQFPVVGKTTGVQLTPLSVDL